MEESSWFDPNNTKIKMVKNLDRFKGCLICFSSDFQIKNDKFNFSESPGSKIFQDRIWTQFVYQTD